MKKENNKTKAVQMMLNATLEEYILYLRGIALQPK